MPFGPRTFDELHHERASALIVFKAVDLRDVRMIERGDELRFPTEACEAFRLVGDRGGQYLDGDVAIEPAVAALVDLAHPAGADRLDDRVGADTCTGQ